MKLLKQGFVFLFLLAFIFSVFAGGDQEKETGPVTVTFMNNESGLPQDFIDSFNEEHAGEINLVRTEWDWTKFVADAMAGTAADLLMIGNSTDVAYYVNRDLFYDMTELFEKSDVIDIDDIEFSANADYKFNKETQQFGTGSWYGLCKDYNNTQAVTYNKEMFTEAGIPFLSDEEPITYQKYYELAQKLTKKDASGNVLVFGCEVPAGWIPFYVSDMAHIEGLSFYTDEKRNKMNEDPRMRELWKFWARFSVEGITPNINHPSPSGWAGSSFESDRVAMVQLGYWFGASLQKIEGYNEKFGWAPSPVLTSGGKRVTNTNSATGVVMYAETPHPEAAFKVFEWVMAGGYGIDRAKTGWGIPPLKSLYKYLPQNNEYNKQRLKVALDDARYFKPWFSNPHTTSSSAFGGPWQNHIDDLVLGKISEDEFIDRFYADVNELLAVGYEETKALLGN